MATATKETKGAGKVECPHCGERRPSIGLMEEHIGAKHPLNRVQGAVETLAGQAEVPDDLAGEIERLAGGAELARKVVSKDAEMAMLTEFQSGVQFGGRMLPEFIVMYRPDGSKATVHAKRILEVYMRKGYSLRRPSAEVYEQTWFHWRCPIPRCADNKSVCELHGQKGSDSNHPLMSPDFMLLHHLMTGNVIHKSYFNLNKKKLEESMADVFAAIVAQNEEEERRTAKFKEDEAEQLRQQAAMAGSEA